jgi:hypothetical protein
LLVLMIPLIRLAGIVNLTRCSPSFRDSVHSSCQGSEAGGQGDVWRWELSDGRAASGLNFVAVKLGIGLAREGRGKGVYILPISLGTHYGRCVNSSR